jgi:hypothetical protein
MPQHFDPEVLRAFKETHQEFENMFDTFLKIKVA